MTQTGQPVFRDRLLFYTRSCQSALYGRMPYYNFFKNTYLYNILNIKYRFM